ncbi:MAG: methyl-accepting chemotaxis protein [Candidatus Cloacimonetes bacterium]|nr:methyl-accepting chemotaxis protein [Candidatus Cloacimonadota bacterium]
MLKNAKIGAKLSVGFGILIATVIVISTMTIVAFTKVNEEVINLVDVNLVKLNNASTIESLVKDQLSAYKSIALGEDYAQNRRIINNSISTNNSEIESISKLLNPENREEAALWTTFINARTAFRTAMTIMDGYIEAGDEENILLYGGNEFTKRQTDYISAVMNFADFQAENMNSAGSSIEYTIQKSIYSFIFIIILGLLVSITFAVIITKMITKPLTECVDIAQNIGSGYTDIKISVDSKDETGLLKSAMKNMVESIQKMYNDCVILSKAAQAGNMQKRINASNHENDFAKLVDGINGILDGVVYPMKETMEVMDRIAHKDLTARIVTKYPGDFEALTNNINLAAQTLEESLIQVDMAVEQISAASNEISSGSQTLAEATSEQASSLEEISSSLEEINSLTGNNADNAKSGLKLADLAVLAVDAGNEAMEKMNNAMEAILKSSQETGKILKNIDEIAFQTNLLALNAAVEAAHAGDAGKGFAVVAEEVKNLALRSAEAAKNTNDLIDEATRNSEMGSRIVEQVTKSFMEMKDQFNKVKSIVNEISASSDEQAHGVNQINTGVNEMNRVTQQNAANAEESASAAEELNSQAAELKGMVGSFNISKKHTAVGYRYTTQNQKALNVTNERRKTPTQLTYQKSQKAYEAKPETLLPLDSLDDDFDDFK